MQQPTEEYTEPTVTQLCRRGGALQRTSAGRMAVSKNELIRQCRTIGNFTGLCFPHAKLRIQMRCLWFSL